MNKCDTLSEEQKRQIRNAMLQSTCFRDAVEDYYQAYLEMEMRNIFSLSTEELGSDIVAGGCKVDIEEFRDSLFNLPDVPEQVRFMLRKVIESCVSEMAFLRVFNLSEIETQSEERPVSIRQIIADLSSEDNIENINKLCGNAETTLAKIREESDRAWKSHGLYARSVIRKRIAHGYQHPHSDTPEHIASMKEASVAFFKTSDSVYELLNMISVECFGVKTPLPSGDDHWQMLWSGNFSNVAWCFDLVKYPMIARVRTNPSDMILEDSNFS